MEKYKNASLVDHKNHFVGTSPIRPRIKVMTHIIIVIIKLVIFSSYSMNSTNSLIRPPPIPPPPGNKNRNSIGSNKKILADQINKHYPGQKRRDSKRISGHSAVERTVSQITYCSDGNTDGNRDSGLVSGSGPESA